MAKLFGFGGDDGASQSQASQRRSQQRTVQSAEGDEQREMGSRRRLMQARASGSTGTLFGAPAGVTLAG